MTRQRKAQIRNREAGMCPFHSRRPRVPGRWACQECLDRFKSPRPIGKRQPIAEEVWIAQDWTRTNGQIARALGVTIPAVRYQRVRRGIEPASVIRPGRPTPYPQGVDWKQTSKELAYRYGVTTKTIANWRKHRKSLLLTKKAQA